ncbi:MAG: endonuclease/exonuclease/phosphatase family protein [Chloroflexi bacterium]|nr:endonuclease/exonuclease/phosphatase family protein [Chloroflexota bacterium]
MSWSALQRFVRRLSGPVSHLVAFYAALVAVFTLLRLMRVSGFWLIDLANTFAPYWYMPLALTFPLSIIVARQGTALSRLGKRRPRGPQPLGGSEKAYRAASIGHSRSLPEHGGAPRKKAKRHRRALLPQLRERWGMLLQIALILVGLLWFAWPGRYKAIEPPQGETFSLVTFNVQGSNAELDMATDWLLSAGADVIVLQETAEGYDHRLQRLYDIYAHEDHIEGSVRIFSRYAILERQILSIEGEPGRLALRLLLDQNGRELAVYAVHLVLPQANWHPSTHFALDMLLRYNETRRNAQARRLLQILGQESKPYLVAGDFNMSDSSLIYDEIAARINDAWRDAGTGAGRTWPVAEIIGLPRIVHPFLRIDYIWYSDELRTVSASIGGPIGSDHLPVKAVFEWASD